MLALAQVDFVDRGDSSPATGFPLHGEQAICYERSNHTLNCSLRLIGKPRDPCDAWVRDSLRAGMLAIDPQYIAFRWSKLDIPNLSWINHCFQATQSPRIKAPPHQLHQLHQLLPNRGARHGRSLPGQVKPCCLVH